MTKKTAKIAITIHLFYPDYNKIICELLSFYKFKFDLLLTCPYQDIIDDFINELKINKVNYNKLFFVLSKNRGRNFGPLLVEYGKILKTYDLIAHIHSKKSLHHGFSRNDWGEYCIKCILGPPDRTEYIIKELTDKKKYGIFCPERFSNAVPYYAYHWLQNFPIGLKLGKELKLKIKNDFVNYPVGGMFWIRNQAISKILNKEWSYSDFPPELGQTDGTTQHALERMIGVSCEDAGLHILKYDYINDKYNEDNNPGFTAYQNISKNFILQEIENYSIISFDIFDTLLYRNILNPDNIRNYVNYPNYKKLRSKTEMILRKNLKTNMDVKLCDITDKLCDIAHIDMNLAIELVHQEVENDLISCNRRNSMNDIVEYCKKLNKKIIYVSDTYYQYKHIKNILNSLSILSPDDIYLSSENGCRKDNGLLWKYILKKENTNNILHFGDNIVSDVQISSDNGIKSFLTLSVQEKLKKLNLIKRSLKEQEWFLIFPLIKQFGDDPFFC